MVKADTDRAALSLLLSGLYWFAGTVQRGFLCPALQKSTHSHTCTPTHIFTNVLERRVGFTDGVYGVVSLSPSHALSLCMWTG